MLFLVEPLTRSEQNTRRDHPITAPSHPATKAIATTEHNVLTHPLKTPHNYPPLTPPLSKGCRYGVLGDATARSRARAAGAARRIVLHDAERGHGHPMTTRGNPRENRHPLRLHRRATVGAASIAIAFFASTLARPPPPPPSPSPSSPPPSPFPPPPVFSLLETRQPYLFICETTFSRRSVQSHYVNGLSRASWHHA